MTNDQLVNLFRRVIIANELDNNLAHVHKFSDPDGVRSGKSGWSFGTCQFDLLNNPSAAKCLHDCGFTDAEILGLKNQTIDPHPLEAKLLAHKEVIAKYDQAQLASCLLRARIILENHDIIVADDTALLAVADYDNQYHLSDSKKPGCLVYELINLPHPATAEDIAHFKVFHTKYGREHTSDCWRRYDNLVKIMSQPAA